MVKFIILAVILLVLIGIVIKMSRPSNPTNPTKIPYNNGFYSGPYNPDLPVIDPTKKNSDK